MHVQEYAEQHPQGGRAASLGSAAAPPGALFMPTRSELYAKGRQDLQRAIAAAGGSLAVAQVQRGARVIPHQDAHDIASVRALVQTCLLPDAPACMAASGLPHSVDMIHSCGPVALLWGSRPSTPVTGKRWEAPGATIPPRLRQTYVILSPPQTLGLRSRRRPVGYWDSPENLDEVRWPIPAWQRPLP